MTETKIKHDLSRGDFAVTFHAQVRMSERGVTSSDISACGRSAKSIVQQLDGTFRVNGFDLDNDELTIICGYNGDTLIITVF